MNCTVPILVDLELGWNHTSKYGIVIRTVDAHKHPYIPEFLHTILGPDYYVLP